MSVDYMQPTERLDTLVNLYRDKRIKEGISKNFENILENPEIFNKKFGQQLEKREIYSLLANYLYEESLDLLPKQHVKKSELKRVLPAVIGGIVGLLVGIGYGAKTQGDFLVKDDVGNIIAWGAGGYYRDPVKWEEVVETVGNYILISAGVLLGLYLLGPISIIAYLAANGIKGFINRRKVKRLLKRSKLFFKTLQEKQYSEVETYLSNWKGVIENLENTLSKKSKLSLGLYILETGLATLATLLGLAGAKEIISGFSELSKMTMVPRDFLYSEQLPPPPQGYSSWSEFVYKITMGGYQKLQSGVSKIKNALCAVGAYIASLVGGVFARKKIDKKYARDISISEKRLESGLENVRKSIAAKVPVA